MTSAIEICNIALSNIKADSINSFDEKTQEAYYCKLKYQFMLDKCLSHGWGFNNTKRGLALLDDKLPNWKYVYSFPSDCLNINYLFVVRENLNYLREYYIPLGYSFNHQIPYEVLLLNDNKVIGCNAANVHADLFIKMDNPNLFSFNFVMALSYLLSSELAIPLIGTEGRALRKESLELYQKYIANARSDDMNQQYHTPRMSSAIVARL